MIGVPEAIDPTGCTMSLVVYHTGGPRVETHLFVEACPNRSRPDRVKDVLRYPEVQCIGTGDRSPFHSSTKNGTSGEQGHSLK